MGTKVRCTCPSCGDIRLDASEMVVRVCTDNGAGSYRFKCPECRTIVLKDADERIVTILEGSGVVREDWKLPLEIMERPREDVAPAISLDDLIDLHDAIKAFEGEGGPDGTDSVQPD